MDNEQNLEDVILEEVLTTPEENPVVVEEIIVEEKPKKKFSVSFSPKVLIIAGAVIVILILAYVFKGQFFAASVNGSLISRHAVVSELEKVSGKSALDSLITEKLINAEADKNGIKITDEEVAAEIKIVEDQVKAQGGTLAEALAAQGLTQEIFEKQILINKKLEKLLADKVGVTDAEIKQYITDNKITVPAGQETTYNEQIKTQLMQQKMSTEATALIASLKAAAKIKYFVNY
ncbi:MAG: SurA N-terminal domain-containing protein [Patescibacteria group bacterium]|nr:SurA N-terminal domain-containing protein [Patescibacteria group bacterium]